MLDEAQQEEVIIQCLMMKRKMGQGGIAEVDDGPNPEQAKIYFDELREYFE